MFLSLSRMVGFAVVCAFILPAYANKSFDGEWAAKAYTYSGDCKRQYAFTLTILEGHISGTVRGNQGEYLLKGAVDASGAAQIDLIGPESGKFITDFSDKKAKGSWTTRSCSGIFKVKKK